MLDTEFTVSIVIDGKVGAGLADSVLWSLFAEVEPVVYMCTFCNQPFARQYSATTHIQKKHWSPTLEPKGRVPLCVCVCVCVLCECER